MITHLAPKRLKRRRLLLSVRTIYCVSNFQIATFDMIASYCLNVYFFPEKPLTKGRISWNFITFYFQRMIHMLQVLFSLLLDGPDTKKESRVLWNIDTENEKTLVCSLSSNPEPTIVWYKNSINDENAVPTATSNQLVIKRSDYANVCGHSTFFSNFYYCWWMSWQGGHKVF